MKLIPRYKGKDSTVINTEEAEAAQTTGANKEKRSELEEEIDMLEKEIEEEAEKIRAEEEKERQRIKENDDRLAAILEKKQQTQEKRQSDQSGNTPNKTKESFLIGNEAEVVLDGEIGELGKLFLKQLQDLSKEEKIKERKAVRSEAKEKLEQSNAPGKSKKNLEKAHTKEEGKDEMEGNKTQYTTSEAYNEARYRAELHRIGRK